MECGGARRGVHLDPGREGAQDELVDDGSEEEEEEDVLRVELDVVPARHGHARQRAPGPPAGQDSTHRLVALSEVCHWVG